MSDTFRIFNVMVPMLALITNSGCYRPAALPAPSFHNIVLRGFSIENYAALESRLGKEVCITGKLSIDSAGVYYPLQPAEEDSVITLGFSRINIGLERIAASREGLRNGRIHALCGLLEDATPFEKCDTVHCKWYKLNDALPQRREQGKR